MALDPSVILQAGKGVTPLLSSSEIEDQQMQREVGGMKLAQLRQGVQDDQTLRSVYSAGGDIAGGLQKNGLYKQSMEYAKSQAEQQKITREAEKAKIEAGLKHFEAVGQIMAGVKDQATYDNARQQAAQLFGPEAAAKLDPVYNPETVARNQQQAMSVKEQLAEKWKAMEYTTPNANAQLQATTSTANNANTVAATDRSTAARTATATAAAQQKTAPKPIPASALKMQQESLDAIGTAQSINADLDAINTQIDGGKLKFGPVGNLANRAMNASGYSSEESRNFASFQANMEKLRNDSLRLNKGVQTDGDAQRAWNELFSNINDTKVVQQRLGEIKRLNERAVQLRKLDIDNVRTNYGHEPLDTTGYEKQPPALNGGGKPPATDLSGLEAELKRRGILK